MNIEFVNETNTYKNYIDSDQFNLVVKRLLHLRRNLCRANGRKGAERKPIEVSLDYLYEIGEKQKWRCTLTNTPLEFERGGRMFAGVWSNPNSCTIDRIDSTKGYIEGNIQLLSWKANCTKGGCDQTEYINICREVVNHTLRNRKRPRNIHSMIRRLRRKYKV